MIVYDGVDLLAPEIQKLSGNQIPPQIVSTGSDIFINLLSDASEVTTGFSVEYEAGKKLVIIILLLFVKMFS